MANGRPALLESEGQFVRRVLIVAGIAALAALLWLLSEILLLVFASALLAVILRSVAALSSTCRRETELVFGGCGAVDREAHGRSDLPIRSAAAGAAGSADIPASGGGADGRPLF